MILSGLKLLGMTTTPRWMLKRRTIWATVLLYFFPSVFRNGSFSKGGTETFTLKKKKKEIKTCIIFRPSNEINRCLLLGRKVMTNLNSILKIRDITLSTKIHLVKAIVFPVVMYGCESWSIKKAECRRIDPFELWCWRRLLRVPWTARRANQSILKEISPGYSLEGLMLKLKLQFGPPDVKSWLIWKDPDAGKDWGQEEKGMTEDEMVGCHHRFIGYGFR